VKRRRRSDLSSDAPSGMNPTGPRAAFAQLLNDHLERGTRPDRVERWWPLKDFSGAVQVSPRSLNAWRNGIGPDESWLPTIYRVLFGKNPKLQHYRKEMELAFHGIEPGGEEGGTSEKITVIPADPDSVYQFFRQRRPLDTAECIDVWLYTAETLLPFLRSGITDAAKRDGFHCAIRALIMNPRTEPNDGTRANIEASIHGLLDLAKAIPNLSVAVRVCDQAPILRLISFRSESENRNIGLLGLYYYDAKPQANRLTRRIVGAESNEMIVCDGADNFSARMLFRATSRFELQWGESTDAKRPAKR
jgi:hypothetical protein